MAIPEYGALIREIRGQLHISLRQMADAVGYSATYLSALEMGERPMTDEFLGVVMGYLRKKGLPAMEVAKVCAAADRIRRTVDVGNLDGEGRHAVAAFARKWDDMGRDAREKFLREVSAGVGGEKS